MNPINNNSNSTESRSEGRTDDRTFAQVLRGILAVNGGSDLDLDSNVNSKADSEPSGVLESESDSDSDYSEDSEDSDESDTDFLDSNLAGRKRKQSRTNKGKKKRAKKKRHRKKNHFRSAIPTGSDVSPLPTAQNGNNVELVTPEKSDEETSCSNEEANDAETNDAETNDAETNNGETNNGETNNGETNDNESQQPIIRWKNDNYCFKRLPTYCTDLPVIVSRAYNIGKLNCTDTAMVSDLSLHRKLEALKMQLFQAFESILEVFPRPKPYRILQNHRSEAGCYGLSTGSDGMVIKYGMGFDCFARADRQAPAFAFQLSNCKYLRERVIPSNCIQEIEKLKFPGLACHSDHGERIRDLIAMHIHEGYLVAAHENNDDSTCITNTIFERFVQAPPVLDNLTCEGSILDHARVFLDDLRSGAKVYAIFSWQLMMNVVYGIAEQSPSFSKLIGSRLHERPKDHFVKLYWVKAILGEENLRGWEDAVKVPPEQVKLDQFFAATTAILERDVDTCDDEEKKKIQDELGKITGDNGESYVRPEGKDMADGFVPVFEKQNEALHKDDYILVEDYLWNVVKKERRDWWDREMDGVTPLRLFNDLRIFLVTTNSKRRIIIVPSFFLEFSPEPCRLDTRIELVKSLIACLELLQQVGVHDLDYVASFRKVLMSYWMRLDFGTNDGSDLYLPDQSAACWTMPDTYMKPPMPNCTSVSNNMDMNVWHMLYLQIELGTVKFGNLLRHMGILHGDEQLWPSHPDWTCPGAPASPNIPAQACGFIGDNDDDDKHKYKHTACMVGRFVGRAHVFYGRFVCRACHRKIQCRELDTLSSLPPTELTPAQTERLQKLQGKTATQYRERKKEALGHEKVFNEDRLHVRKNPPKNPEKAKTTKQAYNKKRDADRQANGKIKSGERRFLGKKQGSIPYPQFLTTRFENACLEFFQRSQKQQAKWVTVQKIFVAILEAKWDRLPATVQADGRTPSAKKVRYRREQFVIAASKFLEPTKAIDHEDMDFTEWYASEFRVKPEFLNRISESGDAPRLEQIYQDIAAVEFELEE